MITQGQPVPAVALVTGGNRGIGLAAVRALAERGWTVWLGTRDFDDGAAAAADCPGDVRPVLLDVTTDSTVAAAVQQLGATGLDVLVNNAGVGGRGAGPADALPADFPPVYAVNVIGVVRMISTALPLLRQSQHPRIVNVSSSIGSFGRVTDPDSHESQLHELVYSSSKAALNMITCQYARALPGVLVNSVQPGYTATRLNGFQGSQTPEQGAEPVVRAATLPPGGPTGTFFGRDCGLPW